MRTSGASGLRGPVLPERPPANRPESIQNNRILASERKSYLVGARFVAAGGAMRENEKVMRRGRTTIPVHFRRRHGIEEGSQVILEDRGHAILIRPLPQLEDMCGFLAKATTVERLLKTLRKSRQDHG